ncbi:MAG: hypothetical protein ACTSVU_02930 [Promethearchaeota archaeon]
MTIKVLIDQSHNETIQSIPEKYLNDLDLIFDINNPNDDFCEENCLEKYDLLILGNPRPNNNSEILFKTEELLNIKKFVKNGGSLLITSGSHGDYNFENSFGSLRIFYRLNGIQRYYYSILYHPDKELTYHKKYNLIFNSFPEHPIFSEFEPGEKIVLGKSTFFNIHPEVNVTLLLHTLPGTMLQDFDTQHKLSASNQPIMVSHKYYKGKIVTIAASNFITNDPESGVSVESNSKLLKGIFNWLLSS